MNSETNVNNVDEYLDAIIQKLEAFITEQITKKSNSTG
jgi:cell division septum initiation protein DivIVA